MKRLRLVDRTGSTKTATAVFLAVALCLFGALVPLPARAAEPPSPSPEALAEATARLSAALAVSAPAVELGDLGLPVATVRAVLGAILQDDPTLFYVAPRFSYATRDATVATVAVLYPAYTLTGDALAAAQAVYRATVEDILAGMAAAFLRAGCAVSEAAVVLYLHDVLAARYDYDLRALDPATRGEANADVYTFFREGRGICQAYALAFVALARAAGLEAHLVTSAAMDHAWSHVRVGGEWYHVDVTRDDPVAIRPDGTAVAGGTVSHDRLLRSDAGMVALGYHGFACAAGHACTDTRFEAAASSSELPLVGALAGVDAPLTPVSGAVWVASGADGTPQALTLTPDGVTRHIPGDLDGDGALTPGDLLAVYDPALPERWRTWLRAVLVAGV